MRLTVKSSAALKLPPGKRDHIEFDDDIPGFGVRVREGGSKTFVFQYKLGVKQRRMTLGRVASANLNEARSLAKQLYGQVVNGDDPAKNKKAATKAKAHHTFKALADEYLEHKRKTLRSRTYPDVERHLLVHGKTLHGLQIEKIKRGDIAQCLGDVEKNSGEVTRNRVRTSLMTMFAWAMAEGRADNNPVMGTRRAEERSRDRVLSPTELREIWRALPDNQFGAVMKLLALTGQRASEIADLCWSELDGDAIQLSAERTKNHRSHRVPLSLAALAIIKAQPRRTTSSGNPRDLIFGNGRGGFSGWSKSKAQLDAAVKKASGNRLPHWTPHDLRRSFVTHCNEIGIPPHVIEQCVNHVSGHRAGVAGVYNRASLEPEKRSAMNRWAVQLMAWVNRKETNVTPLRKEG